MKGKSSCATILTGLRWFVAKKKLPPDVLEFFRKQGSKGGKIGGKKAAESMTPEQRSERARKAVAAREAKRKSGKKGTHE
jgi:hypothetical protein